MSAKDRAVEIYNHHLALASTDGRGFRKTVMDQLMAETGCSLAAAATHYNNAKNSNSNKAYSNGFNLVPIHFSLGSERPRFF